MVWIILLFPILRWGFMQVLLSHTWLYANLSCSGHTSERFHKFLEGRHQMKENKKENGISSRNRWIECIFYLGYVSPHSDRTTHFLLSSPLFHREETGMTLASSCSAGCWARCLVCTPITHQGTTPYWCSCQRSRGSSVTLGIASLPSIRLFHTLERLSKHHHLVECRCLKTSYFKQNLKGELWCTVKHLVCCGSEFSSCFTG